MPDFQVSALAEGLPFGAKVTGLTLPQLQDAQVRRALVDLWIDRGVILFRVDDSSELHGKLFMIVGDTIAGLVEMDAA